MNINCSSRAKISAGSLKIVESPDVSLVTSLLGSGANHHFKPLKDLRNFYRHSIINGSIRYSYR